MSRRFNPIIGKRSPLPILPEGRRCPIHAPGRAKNMIGGASACESPARALSSLSQAAPTGAASSLSPGEAMMVRPVCFRMAGRR